MQRSTMKKIYLLLAGIAAIALFLLLPANKKWFKERVMQSWKSFPLQKNHMKEADRLAYRFGSYYTISKQVAEQVTQHAGSKDVLLLVPSTAYFKQMGINYRVPEPAVFYYFTGLKTTWSRNADASSANLYLQVQNKKIVIKKVTAETNLPEIIASFNKYPYSL